MKKIYSLFLAIFLANSIIACSFVPDSFCDSSTSTALDDDVVLSGQITLIDNDGITLHIIDVFKGVELRTSIRIWDGTDFDCNGIFSMAAADLGEWNDTIVVILPKIDTLENSWEVMGDYRRPTYTTYTTSLQVEQGKVKGLIRGYLSGSPQTSITSLSYEVFKGSWINGGECPGWSLSAKEVGEELNLKVTNPIQSILRIALGKVGIQGRINIYTLNGIKVREVDIQGNENIELDFTSMQSGIYLLTIIPLEAAPQSVKLIKI